MSEKSTFQEMRAFEQLDHEAYIVMGKVQSGSTTTESSDSAD
jgi:hypothetical protein